MICILLNAFFTFFLFYHKFLPHGMTNVADSLLNVIFILIGQLMLPVFEIKMASEKKNVEKTVLRRMEIILKIFIFNT